MRPASLSERAARLCAPATPSRRATAGASKRCSATVPGAPSCDHSSCAFSGMNGATSTACRASWRIERRERRSRARRAAPGSFASFHGAWRSTYSLPRATLCQTILQRLVQQEAARAVHRRVVVGEVGGVLLRRLGARAGGNDAAAVALDHRDHAAREIAPRVGEVGVVALLEPLPREAAVAVEGNLAQQEIAERVGAEAVDRFVEVEPHARRTC